MLVSFELFGELPWRSVAECGVRPSLVVVLSPGIRSAPRLEDRRESVGVEQLIADLPI